MTSFVNNGTPILRLSRYAVCVGTSFLLLCTTVAAGERWASITLDNDLFVGNDSGYSNGIYFSAYDTSDEAQNIPDPDFWVKPLLWSLPDSSPLAAVNAYTVGQTMSTPQDITTSVLSEFDLPYSALLFLNNTYLTVSTHRAYRVSTTIGLVGPVAMGEQAQKFVHGIIGSDEPQGWDTQIENELVFQLSRGRIGRVWHATSERLDILTQADISLGTISSGISGGIMLRYGRNLIRSFATPLLSTSRTSNPIAVGSGWYVYSGVKVGYTFNQIFTDGNTFRDSRSIEYDHESVGLTLGLSYAWQKASFTFAVNDSSIIEKGNTNDVLKDLTRYGTITFAWRL